MFSHVCENSHSESATARGGYFEREIGQTVISCQPFFFFYFTIGGNAFAEFLHQCVVLVENVTRIKKIKKTAHIKKCE